MPNRPDFYAYPALLERAAISPPLGVLPVVVLNDEPRPTNALEQSGHRNAVAEQNRQPVGAAEVEGSPIEALGQSQLVTRAARHHCLMPVPLLLAALMAELEVGLQLPEHHTARTGQGPRCERIGWA